MKGHNCKEEFLLYCLHHTTGLHLIVLDDQQLLLGVLVTVRADEFDRRPVRHLELEVLAEAGVDLKLPEQAVLL